MLKLHLRNEGIISKKDTFIRWALPLHRQRLGDSDNSC